MKCWISDFKFGLAVLALLTALFANAQERGMEISGFRVPEYDEKGQMTSQLFGDHAELGADNLVKIEGVRVEFYREGETFMKVASSHCFYDQKKRMAHSDAPIRADMEGVQLTGTGYVMDARARTVQVLDKSRVVIADIMQQTALDAEAANAAVSNVTEITSQQLFLNYDGKTARFVDSVHVEDPELKLDSGSLELRFSENNEIDWIEALTDVRILHEGREAYAGKAVYDLKTDEFVLEDEPKLVEGKNMLFGETIRFWRESGRMICEPAARVVIYPDGKFKSTIFEN